MKRKLLMDKNFKLTSLQVNPIYKPVFDKLDALAQKELNALDNSVLWSRHYTKQEFKHGFAYPLVVFAVVIYFCITKGVKYRLYMQHIRLDRRLEFSDRLDIDLDDVESYPPSIYEEYVENQKYKNFIKRKDEKIDKICDEFHDYLEKRATDTIERRKKKGLHVRKRQSPLEAIDANNAV